MKVQILLHDNTSITADISDYNAADMATKLNDPKLLMVAIGDIVINKNGVKLITPVVEG